MALEKLAGVGGVNSHSMEPAPPMLWLRPTEEPQISSPGSWESRRGPGLIDSSPNKRPQEVSFASERLSAGWGPAAALPVPNHARKRRVKRKQDWHKEGSQEGKPMAEVLPESLTEDSLLEGLVLVPASAPLPNSHLGKARSQPSGWDRERWSLIPVWRGRRRLAEKEPESGSSTASGDMDRRGASNPTDQEDTDRAGWGHFDSPMCGLILNPGGSHPMDHGRV
ncbi:uncharacterized protein PS065_006538 [Dugong dugon]